jgi:hypothetical protein
MVFVYCTTCLSTGQYYIGAHQTDEINDGYLGSGRWIKKAVLELGESAFSKEVIAVYNTVEEAFAREELLVRCHRRNKLCMNIRKNGKGGAGGFSTMVDHKRKLSQVKGGRNRALKYRAKEAIDPTWAAKMFAIRSANGRSTVVNGSLAKYRELARIASTGRKHTLEERLKLSASHTGVQNSQYGTFWITNGTVEKKMGFDGDLERGWFRGRINKPPNNFKHV